MFRYIHTYNNRSTTIIIIDLQNRQRKKKVQHTRLIYRLTAVLRLESRVNEK